MGTLKLCKHLLSYVIHYNVGINLNITDNYCHRFVFIIMQDPSRKLTSQLCRFSKNLFNRLREIFCDK